MKKVLAAITILLAVAIGANAGTYTKPLYYAKTSDWDSVRVFIKVMNAGAEVDLCDSLITANDTLIYTLDEDSAYHGHEQWYTSGALFGQPSWTWDRQRTQANVVQLSGDGTAADNLEAVFDGTGSGADVDLSIRRVTIATDVGNALTLSTSGSSNNALYASSTNGPGVVISGTVGAQIVGTSTLGLLVNGSTLDIVGDISGDILGTVTALDTLSTGDTIAVMPSEWVAADSAGYQGSASGLDSATVYSAVAAVGTDSTATLYMNDLDSSTVYDAVAAVAVDSSSLYQGTGLDSTAAYGAAVQALEDSSVTTTDDIYDDWSSILTSIGGQSIFFSPCQVSANHPDSTNPSGWGTSSGTVHLTSERYLEGYSRAMYIEEGSINTLKIAIDTGTYIMSADVWLTSATADTAFFQAYKADDAVQSWTDGENVEYINGFTGWRKITQTIRLTKDTLYYFTVGANTGDSAYFANVCVQPFAATGNRMPGGHGGGIYAVDLYALDTLGDDSVRSGVKLAIVDATGELIDDEHTNSSGYFSFRLNDGTYTVSGYKTGYVFSDYELTVSGADIDSAAVLGYNVTITAATEPNTCTVYGYVYNLAGTAVDHATVTFTLKGAVNDTCSGVFLSDFSKTTYTDSDGLFEQALIYSSCLAGKKYDMVIEYADGTQKQGTFTVPDASTYEIPIE